MQRLWKRAIFSQRPFTTTSSFPLGLDSRNLIQAACLMHRPAITMRQLTRFEREYEQYRLMLEAEESRGVFRIGTANSLPVEKGNNASEAEDLSLDGQGEVETQNFTASQGKEWDHFDKDEWDLRRKLDQRLYLVVKDAQNGKWKVPTVRVENEESPLNLISRNSLRECFDINQADIYWIGNAPTAFSFEQFEGRVKAPFGVKTFFFPARLLSGSRVNMKLSKDQFAWLSKEELSQKLDPGLYNSLKDVLSV